jgi:hypothetical protein
MDFSYKHDQIAYTIVDSASASLDPELSARLARGLMVGKIRHFQGFKRGNLTQFLADVFTPNAHPIGQTPGMAGLPLIAWQLCHFLLIMFTHITSSPPVT